MRTPSALAIAFVSLVSSALHAEEASFHNMLSVSRTILSPSQYYQVKEGAVVEADLGSSDGSIEIKIPTIAQDRDIKGSHYGVAGFIAVNPSLVFGLKAAQERLDFEKLSKIEELALHPSVTFSPVAGLSLAAQVNIIRGSEHLEGSAEKSSDRNNFTFGMTAHQANWEATAVLSTKKEDDDNAAGSIPQEIGLHARYRLIAPITLGLSYEQSDDSGIAAAGTEAKDQTRIAVHMEAAMSEMFAVEVDYFATTHDSGVKDQDSSEFVLLAQALLSPTLEAGARLSYDNVNGNEIDVKRVSPGLFIAAKF